MTTYLEAVNERVVIFDGAMGTGIQARGLTIAPIDWTPKPGGARR